MKKIIVFLITLIFIIRSIYFKIQGPFESYYAVNQLDDGVLSYSWYRYVSSGDLLTTIQTPIIILIIFLIYKVLKNYSIEKEKLK